MALSARSQYALFTSVFLSCVSFAIVMPSMWPYLHSLSASKSFLAYVVAFYSVGEALGAILFGALTASLSTRFILTMSSLLGALGSLLYVTAELFPGMPGASFVLVGRFAQGMWTGGAQAVQQTYLSKTLPFEDLTVTTVTLNAYACLGFVIGPAFALLFDLIPPFGFEGGVHFNELTAPGYFVLLSSLFTVWLYVAVLDEEGDLESMRLYVEMTGSGGGGGCCSGERDLGERTPLLKDESGMNDAGRVGEPLSFRLKVALIVCNVAFFTHFYGFALQETITTPLVQMYYSWTVFSANLLFTGAGFCALVAFFAVGILSRKLSDRFLTTCSLIIGLLGYIMLISTPEQPLSVTRFLLGFGIISVAFPVGRATVISLYTKLLPLEKQGVGQGIILAVGAVARILGPFWAVRAFYFRLGGLIVFGATAGLFGLCLLAVAVCYPSLQT